jgi:two-component system chemotaxis response regulator CheY
MKVLIVDDSPIERLFLSVFFEGIAEVDFAVNGEDGVKCVKRTISSGEPYDLICLDITMPVMDGLEALQNIRLLEATSGMRHSKIFMITSNSSPEDMISAITIGGCDDYIVKPVIVDTLFKLLSKHGLIEGTDEE